MVQAATSLTLITGWIITKRDVSSTVVILRLFTKIGIWPIHRWLVGLISKIRIHSPAAITLITWQKVIPIIIISNSSIVGPTEIKVIIALTLITLVAPLTKISEKKRFKRIIALSSINNNAWLLTALARSTACFTIFITVYSLSLALLLKTTGKIKKDRKNIKTKFWVTAILVANTMGLPPMSIFWVKIKIIKTIINTGGKLIVIILVASAVIIIYQYLNATLREIIKSNKKAQIKPGKTEKNLMWRVSALRITRILIIIT